MYSLYNKTINIIPAIIGGVGVVAATTLILIGVVANNLQLSVSGVQTVSQLVLVWLSFLLAGALAIQGRHIQVNYFVDKLPETYQRYHRAIMLVLNMIVCFVLVWGGIAAIEAFWNSVAPGTVRVWGLERAVPISLYYVAPVVGLGMLLIVYSIQLAELFGIVSLSNSDQP